jgi:hypothetical protein
MAYFRDTCVASTLSGLKVVRQQERLPSFRDAETGTPLSQKA